MMNALLWTLQTVLALVFAGAGAVKLIAPRDQLAKTLGGWVYDFLRCCSKPLGLVELLGAVGLIVPPLVHVAPILTPVAAVGLVVTMIGAVVTHARRGEFPNVVVDADSWRSWPRSLRGDASGPTTLRPGLPGNGIQLLTAFVVELDGGHGHVLLQVSH